ncbi:MAG: T9SS type A sorting domain-containing protein [Ignavibacteriaceae bacterium]|jgi:hypothetical protein|nr:T9SS type A sorting domain-containing protein [Ignavibacteriaceae bacterium]
MKKFFFIFVCSLLLLIVSPTKTEALVWELGFKIYHITEGDSIAESYAIKVYKLNTTTRVFNLYRSGYSKISFTGFGNSYLNGGADIADSNQPSPTFDPLEAGGKYLIMIGERFYIIEYSGSGAYGDITFNYNTGTEDFTYSKSSGCGYNVSGPTVWSPYNITLKNDFGSDRATATGSIQFNGEVINNVGINGVTLTRDYHSFPHTATAINNQVIDGYKRVWRKWNDDDTSLSRSLSSAEDYNLTAIFAKELNTNFNTNVPGGYITIGGSNYPCPTSSYLKFYGDSSYTVYAPNQFSSNFYYTFSQWKKDGSYYSSSSTINFSNLTSHLGNYTAEYTYQLSGLGESVSFGTVIGDPIEINWNDNPNATNYQIWRKNRNGGGWTTPVHIGTVNPGVQTYTDYDCTLNVWKQGIEIEYDVRGYYSGNNSYQDPLWSAVYGEMYKLSENTTDKLPLTYNIENYPNPFNPETIIKYSIPQTGLVEVRVYDSIGKEITTLINKYQEEGNYEVYFNGKGLTSGIYIITLRSGKTFLSKKILLLK